MTFDLSWLATQPVSSIALRRIHGRKGVVYLSASQSVVEALNTLVDEEILSAPVWDEARGAFVAHLDMRDIVNLIAKSLKQHDEFDPKKLIEALSQDEQFTKPISQAFDFNKDFNFFFVTENTSILDVIHRMVEAGDKHHRRVLVFAENAPHTLENLRSMVSQSAIINLIAAHKSKLGPSVANLIADSLKVDWQENFSRVISISSSSSMTEAFALMGAKDVSGVAVLDEHGQLLGTLGSRDVKGLITHHRLDLSRLRMTVREFINYVKMLSVDEKHPAISVKKTDTIGTLVGKFSSTHVHRIFVIDEHNSPIGVISTIDLLKILVH